MHNRFRTVAHVSIDNWRRACYAMYRIYEPIMHCFQANITKIATRESEKMSNKISCRRKWVLRVCANRNQLKCKQTVRIYGCVSCPCGCNGVYLVYSVLVVRTMWTNEHVISIFILLTLLPITVYDFGIFFAHFDYNSEKFRLVWH